MDWKKTKKMAKAIGKGLVEGIDKGIDNMVRIRREYEAFERSAVKPVSFEPGEEFILTAATLQEIKWMGAAQLRAIFDGKKVKLDGKPETFRGFIRDEARFFFWIKSPPNR